MMSRKASSTLPSLIAPGVGSLAVKLGQVLAALILSIMLARLLGAEQYGIYAFSLSLVSFIAIPAQIGLPPLVVRETAKSLLRHDLGLMKGIWSWANTYVLMLSIALLVLGFSLFYFFGEELGLEVETINVLLIGLFVAPVTALAKIRGASLQGLSRVVLGQMPESIVRPGIMIMALGSAYFLSLPFGLSAQNVMLLHLSTVILAYIFGAIVLKMASPQGLKEGAVRKKTLEWRRAVIPLALIGGVQLINSQFDIIMLGFIRTNEEVGIYRVAVQLGALVVFALSAITMAIQPSFARLHANKDSESLRKLVVVSARFVFMLALVPIFLYAFFGEWVLITVFGADFKAGYTAVMILAAGQLVNAVVGSVGALLNMTGYESDSLKGLVVASCFNVLGNIILIPLYGIEGAAASTAISLVVCNLLLWFFVKKRLGINSFAFSSYKREIL